MSDWLRIVSPLPLAGAFIVCAAWAAGGWLLVRALFHPRPGEALTVGVSTGFVLFLMGANLLTGLLTLPGASAAAAGLILLGGLAAARASRLDWHALRPDLSAWPQVLLLAILALFFTLAKRGVSLADDYLHMPLVSVMGSGDIPPHFYLNPNNGFAYHYGLQIFAAVLERLPAMFPWSAWDLARGAAISFTLVLGWVWVRRYSRSGTKATLGSILYTFGGGTRWLLLLLPSSILLWASNGVQMAYSAADSGPTLVSAITRPFVIEGSGPMPFAFAYRNGNFEPLFFNLAGTGAMMFFTVLLLLLLSQETASIKRPGALVVFTLVLASLALSAEHLFALWWAAIALVLLLRFLFRTSSRLRLPPVGRDELLGWFFILGFSALLSAVQGGYITETLRSLAARLAGSATSISNVYGFSFRWPPAILNAHFGSLSLFDPRQLLVLLFELGPVLLLAPLATRWAWKTARMGQTWQASLGLAAWLCLVFTLFVEYGVDRSSNRFAGTTLWIWMVLAFPALTFFYRNFRPFWKVVSSFAYGATVLSGVVLLAIEITSIPAPVPTYFIAPLDLRFTREFWNRLEPGAQVMDSNPERAVTIFGRAATTNSDIYKVLPAYDELVNAPDPYHLRAYGFSYAYISNDYWDFINSQSRQKMSDPCVRLVHEETDSNGNYRKLLDLKGCQ